MRTPSLADQFIAVMAEIAEIEAGVDNDHPHRYPLRCLRQVAHQQIENALAEARRIADLARVLKKETTEGCGQ